MDQISYFPPNHPKMGDRDCLSSMGFKRATHLDHSVKLKIELLKYSLYFPGWKNYSLSSIGILPYLGEQVKEFAQRTGYSSTVAN